ncbi:uncharacterized protein LOC113233110 [Hyposmocoma kahamanoa]|uniref:uncharacterized protein LOC113233110 n=1 Tax=Hyposmocoma kahamanoa TaxID=1477025 RepID=UPI000E6D84C9|nr:uncharacterized protein LOC113233110 [Hyposmocoma kahamanoa]
MVTVKYLLVITVLLRVYCDPANVRKRSERNTKYIRSSRLRIKRALEENDFRAISLENEDDCGCSLKNLNLRELWSDPPLRRKLPEKDLNIRRKRSPSASDVWKIFKTKMKNTTYKITTFIKCWGDKFKKKIKNSLRL